MAAWIFLAVAGLWGPEMVLLSQMFPSHLDGTGVGRDLCVRDIVCAAHVLWVVVLPWHSGCGSQRPGHCTQCQCGCTGPFVKFGLTGVEDVEMSPIEAQ